MTERWTPDGWRTKPVAQIRTHAGITKVIRYTFTVE